MLFFLSFQSKDGMGFVYSDLTILSILYSFFLCFIFNMDTHFIMKGWYENSHSTQPGPSIGILGM